MVLASSTLPLPHKIAETIWKSEFVAMWELLPEELTGGPETKSGEEKDKKKAPKILNIAMWVLGFSMLG